MQPTSSYGKRQDNASQLIQQLPFTATQIDIDRQAEPPSYRGRLEGHTQTPAVVPSRRAFFEMAGEQGQGVS